MMVGREDKILVKKLKVQDLNGKKRGNGTYCHQRIDDVTRFGGVGWWQREKDAQA